MADFRRSFTHLPIFSSVHTLPPLGPPPPPGGGGKCGGGGKKGVGGGRWGDQVEKALVGGLNSRIFFLRANFVQVLNLRFYKRFRSRFAYFFAYSSCKKNAAVQLADLFEPGRLPQF